MDILFPQVKKIAITLLIMDVLILIVTTVAKIFDLSIVMGILYGNIFALLNFVLLFSVVNKALSMDAKHAKHHMHVHYIIRFVLLIVILVIPFLSDKINEWCVVLAMLSPKFTYFSIGFAWLLPKPFKEKSAEKKQSQDK